jgi:integrase
VTSETGSTHEVRIRGIRRYKGQRGTTYTARWVVGGKEWQKTFPTAKLADAHRSNLLVAARDGEPFSINTGLPPSMSPTAEPTTWLVHCIEFVEMKWPDASPRYRKSLSECLIPITIGLSGSRGDRPADTDLRRALHRWAFNAVAHREPAPDALSQAVDWLQTHSVPMAALADPAVVRGALDSMSRTLEGKPVANSTLARRRAAFHSCLEYGVELKRLDTNPLKGIRRKRLPPAAVVDRRRVVNPTQARALLASVRDNDPALEAFFATIYYAGTRPAETLNLRDVDCALPKHGWGSLLLTASYQTAGSAWTDSGEAHEERQLKHRAAQDTRPIPAHPELVRILRRHIAQFALGRDGRLFVARTGKAGVPLTPPYHNPVSMGTIYRAWHRARETALTAQQVTSPLARRPYDLRHACLSTCSTPASHPSRSRSGQATASPYSCTSTPSASTAKRTWPSSGSKGRSTKTLGPPSSQRRTPNFPTYSPRTAAKSRIWPATAGQQQRTPDRQTPRSGALFSPWQVQDSNLRRNTPTDLQSAPIGRSGNLPGCAVRASPAQRHERIAQQGRWSETGCTGVRPAS